MPLRHAFELRLGDHGVVVVVAVGDGDHQHLELAFSQGRCGEDQEQQQGEQAFHAPMLADGGNP